MAAHRTVGAALIFGALLTVGCSSPTTAGHGVIVVDRTGVAQTPTWQQEVSSVATMAARRWQPLDVRTVDVIGAGSTVNDTVRTASVDLHPSCSNPHRCTLARQEAVTAVASVSQQLAVMPVAGRGTDLVAALAAARVLCGSSACHVLLISDGMDSRLLTPENNSAVVSKTLPLVPDLSGVTVELSGLGADGSNSAAVERAKTFWSELLAKRGAVGVRIGRSI